MKTLKVSTRELKGRKTNLLRSKKIIPAVVYGQDFDSLPVDVSVPDFLKVYKSAGESSLINLEIKEKKPIKVLIYKIQRHVLTDDIIHIDFYKIKAGEKITVEVELTFVGISPAVKELNATLLTPLTKLEIECLPKDLISEFKVDISSLKEFGDAIRVGDLDMPEKIKLMQIPEEIIVVVEERKKEKEEIEKEKSLEQAEEEAKEEKKTEEEKKEEVKEEADKQEKK